MGDRVACILSECLADLPLIKTLNLADNNLTGASVAELVKSLSSLQSLESLDLSENSLNSDSLENLAKFVGGASTLRTLALKKTGISDATCARLVAAFRYHGDLQEIDLSHNMIGDQEAANVVDDAGLHTGGEALADFLESKKCKVKTLKLGFNCIRLYSAIRFASTFRTNRSLTYLDVSFNGLGPRAGELIGHGLASHGTLRELVISNNSLDPRACMVICAALLENTTLVRLNMDANCLGQLGAFGIMLLPLYRHHGLAVSYHGCNTLQRATE